MFKCKYPINRPGQKYTIQNCMHETFEHLEFKQTRRGDEAPTAVSQCKQCKMLKLN